MITISELSLSTLVDFQLSSNSQLGIILEIDTRAYGNIIIVVASN
jgi:hypothetical protein